MGIPTYGEGVGCHWRASQPTDSDTMLNAGASLGTCEKMDSPPRESTGFNNTWGSVWKSTAGTFSSYQF